MTWDDRRISRRSLSDRVKSNKHWIDILDIIITIFIAIVAANIALNQIPKAEMFSSPVYDENTCALSILIFNYGIKPTFLNSSDMIIFTTSGKEIRIPAYEYSVGNESLNILLSGEKKIIPVRENPYSLNEITRVQIAWCIKESCGSSEVIPTSKIPNYPDVGVYYITPNPGIYNN